MCKATARRCWFPFSLHTVFVVLQLLLVLVFVFYLWMYLGWGNPEAYGPQGFAANGVAQIAPAAEMNRQFADCRNFITSGPGATLLWNSVVYFGGRYMLTMQVPVQIDSSVQGHVTGAPNFYLWETSSIHVDSGQIGARFSRNFEFGPKEWAALIKAGGDFGAIGFQVKQGPPVENFEASVRADRSGR